MDKEIKEDNLISLYGCFNQPTVDNTAFNRAFIYWIVRITPPFVAYIFIRVAFFG